MHDGKDTAVVGASSGPILTGAALAAAGYSLAAGEAALFSPISTAALYVIAEMANETRATIPESKKLASTQVGRWVAVAAAAGPPARCPAWATAEAVDGPESEQGRLWVRPADDGKAEFVVLDEADTNRETELPNTAELAKWIAERPPAPRAAMNPAS